MTAQEKLIAIYEQAEKRLFAIIQKKGAFASAAVYERSLLRQVQKELNRLKANSAKTVDELVIENYQNSLNELIEDLKKIGAPIDTDITPAQLAMSKLNTQQIELIARNATGDFNKAINIIGRRTQDMIRTVTLEATAQKLSTGQTIRQMQKSLTEIFKARNVFSVPYKNGASMPIKKYAEMTARSTTAETQNKAQTTQGMEWGYDLVEMTSHSPTCPICAMYQGRVYAITKEAANGKYKAPDGTPLYFPYLYDTAFVKGYETIHPNCRHRISIFPARAYKKEELLKFSQKSTAPFEDTRTDAERKAYAEQQAEKRRRNENYKQYERIKAVLPNDAPKSFAGFVRMKQANSEKYQELMSDYRYVMRESRKREENKSDYLRNNLPKNYEDKRKVGNPISEKQLHSIIEYATSKGVQIGTVDNPNGGFDTYCGDMDVLYSLIDETERQIKNNQFKSAKIDKLILKYDNVLGYDGDSSKIDVGAFAETKGHTVILNKFMFDDSTYLKKEYQDAMKNGLFVADSTIENIMPHEIGHIIDHYTKGLYSEIVDILTRQAKLENMSINDYLKSKISIYSVDLSIDGKYKELISEINSLLKTNPDSDIIKLLKSEGVLI